MNSGSVKISKENSILLVEDDDAIREALHCLLKEEGYSVEIASNGKEALEALQRMHRPCVILLDLMMPVMNGWEFLKVRETDKSLRSIPVVVISAAGDTATKQLTTVNAILKKPIELDTLSIILKRNCA